MATRPSAGWGLFLALAGLACDDADSGKAPAKADAKLESKTDAKTAETASKAQDTKAPEAKVADTKAVPADDGPDPCSLATRERAAAALKSPVAEGVRSGNACRWKAETGPGSVTIEITPKKGAETYDHELTLLGSDSMPSGIGERAFLTGMIVGVHKGDRYISFGVAPNIGHPPMAKPSDAEAFARDVMAAVP